MVNSKEYHHKYYKHIISLGEEAKKEYQVLCANCNWIKRGRNGEIGGYTK